jgi:hypothetical protein
MITRLPHIVAHVACIRALASHMITRLPHIVAHVACITAMAARITTHVPTHGLGLSVCKNKN